MADMLDTFKGNSLISSDLFQELLEDGKRLAGGGRGYRRISLRGGRFRQIVDGEQIAVNSSGSMNVVILNSSKVARFYYEGTYSSEEKGKPPTCWSLDTDTPAPEVPEDQRQSARCVDCPMNIKGSGQGSTRACRFSQRTAVAIEGDYEHVYQLQLPAMSVFGDVQGGKMPMQAYAKYLAAKNFPPIALVTEMYFDEESEAPKLFFKPARPLTDEELEEAVALRNTDEAKRALEFTVSQMDHGEHAEAAEAAKEEPKKPTTKKPTTKKAKAEEPVEEEEVEDEVEEVEPPTKREKKAKAEEPVEDADLAALVGEWDD